MAVVHLFPGRRILGRGRIGRKEEEVGRRWRMVNGGRWEWWRMQMVEDVNGEW